MERLRHFIKDRRGSFTLEASIMFPILLILTILFIFFSLIIYEKVTLQYKANQIASRMAQTWSSSTMDWETGKMEDDDYVTMNGDGLYWRLTSNNYFDKFGFNLGDSGTVKRKKKRAGKYSENITFDNGFFVQKINVSLEKKLALPQVLQKAFRINSVGASASHPIVEQTELIRNTDFIIYGWGKLQDYGGKYLNIFNKNKGE